MRRGSLVLSAAVLAVVAAVAASPAAGGPSSRVAWTVATVRLARSGNIARGQKLNKDCVDCHGPAGSIDTPEVPDLAGQNPLYTFKQLFDYKVKTRTSDVMNDAVASLSDRDMADLAAFYAAQKPPPRAGAGPARDPAVERLSTVGDGSRLIPACDACHGERGNGNPSFYGMPLLRNQKSVDLTAQLSAFRAGERGNDVYRVMRDVAKRLTDAEIAGLAAFYSGGPAPKAPAAASSPGPQGTPGSAGSK